MRNFGRKAGSPRTGQKWKYFEKEIESLVKQNAYLQRLNSEIVDQNAVDSFLTGAEILRLRSVIQNLLSKTDSKINNIGLDALTDHFKEEIDRLNELLRENKNTRGRSRSRGKPDKHPEAEEDRTSGGQAHVYFLSDIIRLLLKNLKLDTREVGKRKQLDSFDKDIELANSRYMIQKEPIPLES